MTARHSEVMRRRWANPEARAKLLQAVCTSLPKAAAAPRDPAKVYRKGQPPHGPSNRDACRTRMRALWAIPAERERMLAAGRKGAQRALEARGGPIPTHPKYKYIRAVLGAQAARQEFQGAKAARQALQNEGV